MLTGKSPSRIQDRSMKRFICCHGHFYQPPRENPWLGSIEVQDSSAPFHDWNERINAECYAPNGRSRVLDAEGRIADIINNYQFISFDFGPTLLSWISEFAPDVLNCIVEADRQSRERNNGHGNAIAQVYNHIIMPLASRRDKETQVKWGIADFEYHFGRVPEGMWLAETAVDIETLEVLAENGIRFTVLAPHQAKECRRLGDDSWTSLSGNIDSERPYICRLPSGRKIALFFYDSDISHAIAFGRLLESGDAFYNKVISRFSSGADSRLVHLATDGETYGHHHRFGDMALAYVLKKLEQDRSVEVTNYANFLERFPPEWEVRIHEDSSWSCAHGIERWRSDCGCNAGHAGWHQKWRAPLRQGLDRLKARLDSLFELLGAEYFSNPWKARDAYIKVILDRQPKNIEELFKKHGRGDMSQNSRVKALKLLEMQRHGLFMFTSCAWFFDDIGGLEAVQNLKYACQALQLAKSFGSDFESEFLQYLEKAPSNEKEPANGRILWDELIRPSAVDLERVLAHYAISSLYRMPVKRDRVYCFDITVYDIRTASHETSALAVGRLSASSRLTLEEKEMFFAVVRFGSLDFQCTLSADMIPEKYSALQEELFSYHDNGSMSEVYRVISKGFPEKVYGLKDLFAEEQRRLIAIALSPRLKDYDQTLDKLLSQDENVIKFLVSISYPVPRQMRAVLANSLEGRAMDLLSKVPSADVIQNLGTLWSRARKLNYQFEKEKLARMLTVKLEDVLEKLKPGGAHLEVLGLARKIVNIADMLGLQLNLWKCQNIFLDSCSECRKPALRLQKEFESFAMLIGISRTILKWG